MDPSSIYGQAIMQSKSGLGGSGNLLGLIKQLHIVVCVCVYFENEKSAGLYMFGRAVHEHLLII